MNLTPQNVASYWLNSLKQAGVAEGKAEAIVTKEALEKALDALDALDALNIPEKAENEAKNDNTKIASCDLPTEYGDIQHLKELCERFEKLCESKKLCEGSGITEFVLYPLVYIFKPKHKPKQDYYFPLMIYGKYSKETKTIEYTSMAFPRTLLHPFGEQSGSLDVQPILMTVDEAEAFISENQNSLQDQDIDTIAQKVKERIHDKMCGYNSREDKIIKYEFKDAHFFQKFQSNGSSVTISQVYETIRDKASTPSTDELELFKTIATYEHKETPLYDPAQHKNSFYDRLGHGSCVFPLAPAQRNALSSFMQSATGTAQAVNGPPGTGKTTLLLSVVASLLVKHALKGEYPPCIAASSANNKAVINIIDAFGKDFSSGKVNAFAGRWLPKPNGNYSESPEECTDWSLGFYIVAQSQTENKEKEESLKNYFYTTLNPRDKKYYLPYNVDCVAQNESFSLEKAQHFFLEKAQQAFPELRNSGATVLVRDVVEKLRNQLQDGEKKLKTFHDAYHAFECALQIFKSTPHLEMRQNITAMEAIAHCRDKQPFLAEYNTAQHTVQQFLAEECFMYPLFDWIPAVRKKRFARLALRIFGFCTANPNLDTIPLIEETLKKIIDVKTTLMDSCGRYIAALDAVLSNPAGESIVCKADDDWQFSFDKIDAKVDTGMRFSLFRLAVHYWEGRWLMEAAPPEKGPAKLRDQRILRTQLMLTPCVVSTFFTMPRALASSKKVNNNWKQDFWLDFLDLLIIDEAGQATPEIAGAAFALAKRALIVGDTQQIEPIWSTSRELDIANTLQTGICKNSDEYEAFAATGRASASGSIMAVAQTTSPDTQTSFYRGMFLDEHRRCYDSIIQYCNELCYQGQLTPRRGRNKQDSSEALPCMGYVHVNGICTAGPSGTSKCNSIEAATIAAWITKYKDVLLKMYQQEEINSVEKKYKTISDIVAVVAPFSAQAQEIRRWLEKKNLNGENITVGTVHSLQGAERPVVIFSPTYTQQTPGSFIGRSNSMLNVAVSRAKDSFLVFGDMDFLESDTSRPKASGDTSKTNSPCQLLSKMLHAAPNGDLSLPGSFTVQDMQVDFAKDDRTKKLLETDFKGSTLSWLTNANEHDAFLRDALQTAKNRVVIFSPWLRQERLTDSKLKLGEEIKNATARNVVVSICVDRKLTLEMIAPKRTKETECEFEEILCKSEEILRKFVESFGAELIFFNKIHNKDCSVDDRVLCTGSFNWLSAQRDGSYCREETSAVCEGGKVVQERINTLLQRLPDQPPA